MPFFVEYYCWVAPKDELDEGRYELDVIEFDTFEQAKDAYDKCPCNVDIPQVSIYDEDDNRILLKENYSDGVEETDYRKENE